MGNIDCKLGLGLYLERHRGGALSCLLHLVAPLCNSSCCSVLKLILQQGERVFFYSLFDSSQRDEVILQGTCLWEAHGLSRQASMFSQSGLTTREADPVPHQLRNIMVSHISIGLKSPAIIMVHSLTVAPYMTDNIFSTALHHLDDLVAVRDPSKTLRDNLPTRVPSAQELVPPTEQEVAGNQLEPGGEGVR